MDSIDVALCDVGPDPRRDGRFAAALVVFDEHPFPEALRARLLRAMRDERGTLPLICSLHFEVAQAFAHAAEKTILTHGIERRSIAAIASHGQTVYHLPPQRADRLGASPSTLQLGEPSVIAVRTGLRVVGNFRAADMAVGGQGAPLVPFADYHMFGRPDRTVVVHNIGGMANLTLLPARAALDDVVAFDTGPGNVLIDSFVTRLYAPMTFDEQGRIAAQGRVIPALLDLWMAIPFVTAPPPKSTGRELFGPQLVDEALVRFPDARPEDFVTTATRFSARSFAENLRCYVLPSYDVEAIYLAGGGALNPTLREFIAQELRLLRPQRPPHLGTTEELGVPAKARETMAFAILGYARLHGLPANVPRATGATRKVLLGTIADPS